MAIGITYRKDEAHFYLYIDITGSTHYLRADPEDNLLDAVAWSTRHLQASLMKEEYGQAEEYKFKVTSVREGDKKEFHEASASLQNLTPAERKKQKTTLEDAYDNLR